MLAKSSDVYLYSTVKLEDLVHHEYRDDSDILVLDVCEQTNSDILQRIFHHFQEKKIMILTASDNHYFLASMLHMGARGCFIKSNPVECFIQSLIDLFRNNAYLPDELFNKLYCELPTKFENKVSRVIDETHQEIPVVDFDKLTPREHEILKLIIAGEQSSQIADNLFISEHTVNTHRKHILKKLGVRNTNILIRCVLEQGEI